MPALVAGIHVFLLQGAFGDTHAMGNAFVYIVTNRRNGILYIGVTSDLRLRIFQHRTGAIPGFTSRYGLKMLVWYERYDDIVSAIQREKTMKHWPRAWKVRTIMATNPNWRDLYDELNV